MTALFNTLTSSVVTPFTANVSANSNVLANPSTTTGIFLGLPVFGAGIPRGAVLTNLNPLTLSAPATAGGTSVALSTGFLTTGRRLKLWSEVTAQPALFLRSPKDTPEYSNIILPRLTIHCEIWIYSNAGQNSDIAPEIMLNNLLDAIDSAMAPDDSQTGRFTLGGLVDWCRVVGQIEKEPGDLDGQAIAVADVEIIVP